MFARPRNSSKKELIAILNTSRKQEGGSELLAFPNWPRSREDPPYTEDEDLLKTLSDMFRRTYVPSLTSFRMKFGLNLNDLNNKDQGLLILKLYDVVNAFRGLRSFAGLIHEDIYDTETHKNRRPFTHTEFSKLHTTYNDFEKTIKKTIKTMQATARKSAVPLATVTEEAYQDFITKNEKGFYLADLEEVPLKTFLQKKEHIVLVTPEKDALCFDSDYFKRAYQNKNESWFYECIGNIIPDTNDRSMQFDLTQPYIRICISRTGMNGYVPAAQIWNMLWSNNKVFFIEPHMVEEEQQMIIHTVGHLVATDNNATGVSANHCQHGSNILILDIHEYAPNLRFSGSPTSHGNSLVPRGPPHAHVRVD